MIDMTREEVIELCGQAIEAEEKRLEHIDNFLKDFPLDTDMNRSITLELAMVQGFIEDTIADLQKKREELTLK